MQLRPGKTHVRNRQHLDESQVVFNNHFLQKLRRIGFDIKSKQKCEQSTLNSSQPRFCKKYFSSNTSSTQCENSEMMKGIALLRCSAALMTLMASFTYGEVALGALHRRHTRSCWKAVRIGNGTDKQFANTTVDQTTIAATHVRPNSLLRSQGRPVMHSFLHS